MATSGSIDFSVSRDDIIEEALQICGVVGEGGAPTANQLTDRARTLNMMVKAWQAQGLQLWAIEEIVMFPVKNQAEYSFGTGADRMVLSSGYVKTELASAVTANDTTITVDSVTGMTDGDVIGVQTDEGGIIWTTISDAALDVSIDLAAAITSDAAVDNNVYTYTTAFTQRILDIQNMWRKTDSGVDIPIALIPRSEYIDLSDKTSNGVVNQAYFDPQLDPALLSLWQVPGDGQTDEVFYMKVSRSLEDFDAAGNTPDFPQEWYLALVYGLAELCIPIYGIMGERAKFISGVAGRELQNVLDWDNEGGSVYIMPDDQHQSYRRDI